MTTLLAADVLTRTSTGEAVTFWVLGTLALVGALGVVMAANAVYCAMFLAMTMIILAVFYMIEDAMFLGVVQIVVYTGAVMMLFLFVLMLIGVDSAESLVETLRGQRVAAVVAGLGFGIVLIAGIGNVTTSGFAGLAQANAGGNVQGLAALLFTQYRGAFELTSALLITAAIGAMLLAHRSVSSAARRSGSCRSNGSVQAATPLRCPVPASMPATTLSTRPPGFPTAPSPGCRCPRYWKSGLLRMRTCRPR